MGSEDAGAAKADSHEESPDGTARPDKDWARIYAPKKVDGEFEDLAAKRKVGEGPILSSKLVRGKPGTKESATVPYNEALPAYRDAAEKAMQEGSIPSEYRDHVRKYFDKLK